MLCISVLFLLCEIFCPRDSKVDPAGIMGIGGAVSAVTQSKPVLTRGEDMCLKGYACFCQGICHEERIVHVYARVGKGVPQKGGGGVLRYVLFKGKARHLRVSRCVAAAQALKGAHVPEGFVGSNHGIA